MRFLDHTFALDGEWLESFLATYGRQCDLPFRCHLRANAADDDTVRRLAEAGCQLVDVEVASSSNLIRNEIFDMDLSGQQIRDAFTRLKAAGIRTRGDRVPRSSLRERGFAGGNAGSAARAEARSGRRATLIPLARDTRR